MKGKLYNLTDLQRGFLEEGRMYTVTSERFAFDKVECQYYGERFGQHYFTKQCEIGGLIEIVTVEEDDMVDMQWAIPMLGVYRTFTANLKFVAYSYGTKRSIEGRIAKYNEGINK